MSFSPPVVGCLLKKAHKRGDHRHPRTPPPPPPPLAMPLTWRDILVSDGFYTLAGGPVTNDKFSQIMQGGVFTFLTCDEISVVGSL